MGLSQKSRRSFDGDTGEHGQRYIHHHAGERQMAELVGTLSFRDPRLSNLETPKSKLVDSNLRQLSDSTSSYTGRRNLCGDHEGIKLAGALATEELVWLLN